VNANVARTTPLAAQDALNRPGYFSFSHTVMPPLYEPPTRNHVTLRLMTFVSKYVISRRTSCIAWSTVSVCVRSALLSSVPPGRDSPYQRCSMVTVHAFRPCASSAMYPPTLEPSGPSPLR